MRVRSAKKPGFLFFMVLVVMVIPAAAGAMVDGFAGPPFDLEQADSGVDVADAGQGVAHIEGDEIQSVIPLPGVTSLSHADGSVTWATTGAGADPEADTGQAVHRIVDGTPELVANLWTYEETVNPDGNDPADSNPYKVLAADADLAYVVDAGGNDLLRVSSDGTVETIAVFPDSLVSTENIKDLAGCPAGPPDFCGLPDEIPAQAVPTSLAMLPDGRLAVGELRGFPGPTGASRIWSVDPAATDAACPSADCVLLWDGGFTSIVDLYFGDGWLYVVELDEASWAALEIFMTPSGGTINACDVESKDCWEVRTGIPMLTAVSPDANGTFWATRNTLVPGGAEVFALHVLPEGLGLVDTTQGWWDLDAASPESPWGLAQNESPFFYGNPGDVPMMGDWDCDGVDTPGLYRQSDGFVYLRNSNTQGIADISFFFGNPGDVPIAGDFDADGCDTVSVYRPATSQVFVINELGDDGGGLGAAETSYVFGDPGDDPFVGDFDGDGTDTVGLHRPSTGFVYFRNTLTTGVADNSFFWGDPGDVVFAGDWDADGVDTPALFRASNSTFYWRNTNTAGNADGSVVVAPQGTPVPVSGHFG